MFGIAGSGREKIIAVADIESAGASVAILGVGTTTRVIAHERGNLPLEERTSQALASLVIQELAIAAEKALAGLAKEAKGKKVSAAYAVIGVPWARSFAAHAVSHLPDETTIKDEMIGALAQQALADQKEIDRANLIEANVVRVLLNGYPTGSPAGKRAHNIDVFALLSDCDQGIKSAVQESLNRFFPEVAIMWRTSARAILSLVRDIGYDDTCLIVNVGTEATDLISVRKGILSERSFLPQGVRAMVSSFAKDKPPEETLALLDLLERDQCEQESCDALKESIARAEPELVRAFGEVMAKLAATRRLPNDLLLLAPAHLSPWLTRFFSRIDFTQFTATTQPFSVKTFADLPRANSGFFPAPLLDDPGLGIGCALVNIESGA